MQRRISGFTLLEMSIVLVILGLLIGGILVAKMLVDSAQTRSQISEIEKYKVAALTFKSKYGGLPGDLKDAAGWNFTQAVGADDASANASVAGDNLITSCHNDTNTVDTNPPNGYIAFGCENSMFWNHLSASGLINHGFTRTDAATGFTTISTEKELYVPEMSVEGNYLLVFAWQGENYLYVTGIDSELSNNNGSIQTLNALTPSQCYRIDQKMDDGIPITGKVKAFDYSGAGNLILTLNPGSSGTCRNGSDEYSLAGADSKTKLCQLGIKTGF